MWSRQISEQKSAGMRANWMHCCYSNLRWHWNSGTFNLAFILNCTNKDSMKIDKIDSWLIKLFLNWCNILILQNKIMTLQIVSPRASIVDIFVSVYCLWSCFLSLYKKRNVVYFYLLLFSSILVNTHTIDIVWQ